MTLYDYFRILVRNKRLIFFSTSIVAVFAFIYAISMPPLYEAKCKILIVDVNNSGAMLNQSDMVLGVLGKTDPIITQMEVMKTRPIFEEVIKRCHLRYPDSTPLAPGHLGQMISINAVRNSNIIEVVYSDHDSGMAAQVVNTFAQVAAEQNEKLNREDIRNMRLFIEQQLESQKARLEDIEQASVNFKKREKTVSIDLQTRSQIEQSAGIESAIMKLESERQGVLAQKNQIETSLAAPRAQADPFYVSRLNMLEQIKTKLSSIEAEKTALSRQLGEINNRLSTRPQEEVDLTRFLRDEKIAENIYSNLLAKLQELEIKEAAKTGSIKLIEPAIAPEYPVAPQKKKIMASAILLGFFMGYGIAFLLALFKDTPASTDTIKELLPYGILGTVPVLRKKDIETFKTSGQSAASDKIRQIHTNLEFKGIYNAAPLKLLVTSAAAGEGKSVICSNLVYSFAEAGRRTVLVNFDLRRPVFNEFFKLDSTAGITEFLSGEADFTEIISHHDSGNAITFDIIEAGKTVVSPSRLLQRGKIDDFFNQLANCYDVCLFNTPPILSAAETLDFCRHMNGIILVADMMASSTKSLIAMQELLENKGFPILGTIINRTSARL